MSNQLTSRAAVCATLAVLSIVGGACSQKVERTSSGTVDTAVARTGSYTSAAGPGVYVTKTDAKSVSLATGYKLTDENFAQFMRAADSLQALVARDTAARAHVRTNLTDAAATEPDAGLHWLEANPSVNNAIASSGLSVRDYFVMSIAIASAERFMGSPDAAPPTPTSTDNARFLQRHTADLEHLKALRDGMQPVEVRP
jgi:hypothetical protein